MVAWETLLSIQPSDVMDNIILLQKARWFSFAFLNLRSLETLKTTDARKTYLAAKRREHRASKSVEKGEDDEDSFPVESMPPHVSHFPARSVGARSRISPEPEEENPARIPSIADPQIPSASLKLYHSCREVTTQNLGNNFCTGALMMLYNPEPQVGWVTDRSEIPILHWRDE